MVRENTPSPHSLRGSLQKAQRIIPDWITHALIFSDILTFQEFSEFKTVATVLTQKSLLFQTKTLAPQNPSHSQPTGPFGTDSNPIQTRYLYDFENFRLDPVVDLSSKFLSSHHSLPMPSDRYCASNTEFFVLLWSLKKFALMALRRVECPRVLVVLLNHRLPLRWDWLDSSRMLEPFKIEVNWFLFLWSNS